MTGKIKLFPLIAIILAAIAAVLSVSLSTEAKAGCLLETLDRERPNFYSVPETYKFLDALKRQGCAGISAEDFDRVVNGYQLNLVSFAILEGRVTDASERLAPEMISSYVEKLSASEGGVSVNLVVTLTDILYDSCSGSERCIVEHVQRVVDRRTLLGEAGCVFGMNIACKTTQTVNDFQLNSISIEQKPDAARIGAARQNYFCERYRYCSK